MDIISLVALVLTIFALLLAIFQQRSANAHAKELNEIRNSLSTRLIGVFPEYLPDLVNLMNSANESILIACSIATYGHFSDRENWILYKAAIEGRRLKPVPIDLVILDEAGRKKLNEEQFSLNSKSWDEKLREPKFSSRLEIFSRFSGHIPDGAVFVSRLENEQKKALKDSFNPDTTIEISTPLAIHFWIVDENKAIFSVPKFSEGVDELGFFTSDIRLIQALQAIHNRYKRMYAKKQVDSPSLRV